MNMPRVGVGIAVLRDGMVLMGKRKGGLAAGLWAFPGGHLEFEETVEACAIRELKEETGLHAIAWQLRGWEETFFHPDKHYITLFVFVTDFSGEPVLQEPEKCEGWQWVPVSAIPEPYFPSIKGLIERGELFLNTSQCPSYSPHLRRAEEHVPPE